jgi:hypothetical protein
VSLAKNSEKISKKYLTLEEKYQNNEKYQLTYSKLSNPKNFNSNDKLYFRLYFLSGKSDRLQRQ